MGSTQVYFFKQQLADTFVTLGTPAQYFELDMSVLELSLKSVKISVFQQVGSRHIVLGRQDLYYNSIY